MGPSVPPAEASGRWQELEWFLKSRTALGRTELQEMGVCMVALGKTAPRSPAQPIGLKKVVDAVIA
jgi:hypothetical protein